MVCAPPRASLARGFRRQRDRRNGRPTFLSVRYADDFVVYTDGTLEQAEAEKQALAEFLRRELRMELSMEKTRITAVGEGYDFLGYRVVQERSSRTGRMVGKLFIPKSKLKDLRHKIKVKVREAPTGKSLADLIDMLNPIITGWRNYYRYASGASRDFTALDWWMWWRVGRWLRKKHRKARWCELKHRFTGDTRGNQRRWSDGSTKIRFFREGGTSRFPYRGMRIPNGWNADPDEWFQRGADEFWPSFNTLARQL